MVPYFLFSNKQLPEDDIKKLILYKTSGMQIGNTQAHKLGGYAVEDQNSSDFVTNSYGTVHVLGRVGNHESQFKTQ